MAWTWARPADPSVLDGRPLLDLGTGDGQTLEALVGGGGLVVGLDRDPQLLRPGSVNARAEELPFRDRSLAVVLAADLFHHLDDVGLAAVLGEVGRVLRPGGRLVAWWYESAGREAPDAPRYPRPFEGVAKAAEGFSTVDPLELEMSLEPSQPTVGLVARRS